jgi:hypothetical protein
MMKLEQMRRWQWACVAIALGAIAAEVQLHLTRPPLAEGSFIASPQRFESWLLRKTKGKPALRNVVVHPARNSRDLPPGTQWIVTADREYADGGVPTLVPIAFAAPDPYKPQTRLDYLSSPAAAQAVSRLHSMPRPSLLDYLATLHAAAGVHYRVAWWEDPWLATAAWVGASLLLIGGVWPTLINLIAFHSFTRPAQSTADRVQPVPDSAAQELSEIPATLEVCLQLEEAEHSAGALDDRQPPEHAEPAPPMRQLNAGRLEPITSSPSEAAGEFEAKADDYYPTAKHLPQSKDQA